jgi:glycosyltransferase involved in cell wall biosynthesis
MKILIVNSDDGKGGAATACKRLHIALLQQGYDSKLLVINQTSALSQTYSFIANESSLNRFIRKIRQRILNVRFRRQYKDKPDGHYLHTPTPSVFDIKNHELYEWADVINLHWVSSFIDFSKFFSDKNIKPVVWTLHDMNPFTGGCHYSENCECFKVDCMDCPQLSNKYKNYNHQNWEKKSKSNLSNLSIITPSQWLSNQSMQSSLFGKQQHSVIKNAIDCHVFKIYEKAFCKKLFNIPLSNKVIMFIAQKASFRIKGISYLLEIINDFKENVTIVVVGQLENSLEYKNVISLGTIQDEQLLALVYNAANVMVLPSLADNSPNVIIESLSCGTPVVAFEVGGIPELIINGENGFLVEKENTQSLFENINKALEFDWNNVEISEKAHALYNYEKQAKAYYEVFEKQALIANPL